MNLSELLFDWVFLNDHWYWFVVFNVLFELDQLGIDVIDDPEGMGKELYQKMSWKIR